MKRAGKLMQLVVRPDNLFEAFLRSKRGKSANVDVLRFQEHLDEELNAIASELASGCYKVGEYFKFTIFDPKKRTICAAPFRDRVAMHAIMRVCHLVFDNYQLFDSYASRSQKGTYAAIDRVKQFAGKYQWFAKLDVCHFFDSISHEVMMRQLSALFKDKLLLKCFESVINGYCIEQGRGLPIGNLTSQYFANHYLSPADHYLKEKLRVPAMVRYMDDIILFDSDRKHLKNIVNSYVSYVSRMLRLKMHEPVLIQCRFGIPFLGYVVFPNIIHLNQRSRKRFVCHLHYLKSLYEEGSLSEKSYQACLTAVFSFVFHADTFSFRKKNINISWL